jgi:hypothetical protein
LLHTRSSALRRPPLIIEINDPPSLEWGMPEASRAAGYRSEVNVPKPALCVRPLCLR